MVVSKGFAIRMLRLRRELRQEDLAEMSGIGTNYISAIESGKIDEMCDRLLTALGYTQDMDAMLEGLASVTGNRA